MIRCLACDGLLRMRVTGVWVHVGPDGTALASESVWPLDHDPRPAWNRPVRSAVASVPEIEIRWGDDIAFDRAEWMRMWTARR